MTYFTEQKELFESTRENVSEMRVIAAWCLAHRDESAFIPIVEGDSEKSIAQVLLKKIVSIGSVEMEDPVSIRKSA